MLAVVAGSEWPETREGDMWELGEAHRAASEAILAAREDLAGVEGTVRAGMTGPAGAAMADTVAQIDATVPDLADSAGGLGALARNTATEVQYAKLMAIATAIWLFTELQLLLPWSWVAGVGGLIEAVEAAAAVAGRLTLRRMLTGIGAHAAESVAAKKVLEGVSNDIVRLLTKLGMDEGAAHARTQGAGRAMRSVTEGAMAGAETNVVLDATIQAGQLLAGDRDEWNTRNTTGALWQGALGGAVGAGVVHGMAEAATKIGGRRAEARGEVVRDSDGNIKYGPDGRPMLTAEGAATVRRAQAWAVPQRLDGDVKGSPASQRDVTAWRGAQTDIRSLPAQMVAGAASAAVVSGVEGGEGFGLGLLSGMVGAAAVRAPGGSGPGTIDVPRTRMPAADASRGGGGDAELAARGYGWLPGVNPLRGIVTETDTNCVIAAITVDLALGERTPFRAPPSGAAPIDWLKNFAERPPRPVPGFDTVTRTLELAGPGARGVVVVREGGDEFAHAFNAVHDDQGVIYLDGQAGRVADLPEGPVQVRFVPRTEATAHALEMLLGYNEAGVDGGGVDGGGVDGGSVDVGGVDGGGVDGGSVDGGGAEEWQVAGLLSARPFKNRPIVGSAEYQERAERFDGVVGEHLARDPRVRAAAGAAVDRLRQVVEAAGSRSALTAFVRDEPGSAGQVGKLRPEGADETEQMNNIAAHLEQANLRESMTAFYNAGYYNRQRDEPFELTLKEIILPIMRDQNWTESDRLGLNTARLRDTRDQLEGLWRPFMAFTAERVANKGYNYDYDPVALGNVTASTGRWDHNAELSRSQVRRIERGDGTALTGRFTNQDLTRIGLPLGAREFEYLGRPADTAVLPWTGGRARFELGDGPTSGYWRHRTQDLAGLPVVAGVSGTTARMLTTFRLINGDGELSEPDFVLAVTAWMLTGQDHSLYEILRGAEILDDRYAVSGAWAPDDVYHVLGDLGVPVRLLAERAGDVSGARPHGSAPMLPHEATYAERAEKAGPSGVPVPPGAFRALHDEDISDVREREGDLVRAALGLSHSQVLRQQLADAETSAAGLLARLTFAHMLALQAYTSSNHSLINTVAPWFEPLIHAWAPLFDPLLDAMTPMADPGGYATGGVLWWQMWGLGKMLAAGDAGEMPGALTADPEIISLKNQLEAAAEPADKRRFGAQILARAQALRPELWAEMRIHLDTAVDALQALPPARKGTVWRGDWRRGPVHGDWGVFDMSRAYRRGEVTWHHLASTSRDRRTAELFRDDNASTWTSHAVLLEIELRGYAARDIAAFSAMPDEREVLFLPGARFRIEHISVQNGAGRPYAHVKAVEIEPVGVAAAVLDREAAERRAERRSLGRNRDEYAERTADRNARVQELIVDAGPRLKEIEDAAKQLLGQVRGARGRLAGSRTAAKNYDEGAARAAQHAERLAGEAQQAWQTAKSRGPEAENRAAEQFRATQSAARAARAQAGAAHRERAAADARGAAHTNLLADLKQAAKEVRGAIGEVTQAGDAALAATRVARAGVGAGYAITIAAEHFVANRVDEARRDVDEAQQRHDNESVPLEAEIATLVSRAQAYRAQAESHRDAAQEAADRARRIAAGAASWGAPVHPATVTVDEAVPAGRVLLTAGDHAALASARSFPAGADRYLVFAHGTPDRLLVGDRTVPAPELAGLIRADPSWRTRPVTLISCDTGVDPAGGFAAVLSRELSGVPVTAPAGTVWTTPGGQAYVAGTAYTPDGRPRLVAPAPADAWREFRARPDGAVETHESGFALPRAPAPVPHPLAVAWAPPEHLSRSRAFGPATQLTPLTGGDLGQKLTELGVGEQMRARVTEQVSEAVGKFLGPGRSYQVEVAGRSAELTVRAELDFDLADPDRETGRKTTKAAGHTAGELKRSAAATEDRAISMRAAVPAIPPLIVSVTAAVPTGPTVAYAAEHRSEVRTGMEVRLPGHEDRMAGVRLRLSLSRVTGQDPAPVVAEGATVRLRLPTGLLTETPGEPTAVATSLPRTFGVESVAVADDVMTQVALLLPPDAGAAGTPARAVLRCLLDAENLTKNLPGLAVTSRAGEEHGWLSSEPLPRGRRSLIERLFPGRARMVQIRLVATHAQVVERRDDAEFTDHDRWAAGGSRTRTAGQTLGGTVSAAVGTEAGPLPFLLGPRIGASRTDQRAQTHQAAVGARRELTGSGPAVRYRVRYDLEARVLGGRPQRVPGAVEAYQWTTTARTAGTHLDPDGPQAAFASGAARTHFAPAEVEQGHSFGPARVDSVRGGDQIYDLVRAALREVPGRRAYRLSSAAFVRAFGDPELAGGLTAAIKAVLDRDEQARRMFSDVQLRHLLDRMLGPGLTLPLVKNGKWNVYTTVVTVHGRLTELRDGGLSSSGDLSSVDRRKSETEVTAGRKRTRTVDAGVDARLYGLHSAVGTVPGGVTVGHTAVKGHQIGHAQHRTTENTSHEAEPMREFEGTLDLTVTAASWRRPQPAARRATVSLRPGRQAPATGPLAIDERRTLTVRLLVPEKLVTTVRPPAADIAHTEPEPLDNTWPIDDPAASAPRELDGIRIESFRGAERLARAVTAALTRASGDPVFGFSDGDISETVGAALSPERLRAEPRLFSRDIVIDGLRYGRRVADATGRASVRLRPGETQVLDVHRSDRTRAVVSGDTSAVASRGRAWKAQASATAVPVVPAPGGAGAGVFVTTLTALNRSRGREHEVRVGGRGKLRVTSPVAERVLVRVDVVAEVVAETSRHGNIDRWGLVSDRAVHSQGVRVTLPGAVLAWADPAQLYRLREPNRLAEKAAVTAQHLEDNIVAERAAAAQREALERERADEQDALRARHRKRRAENEETLRRATADRRAQLHARHAEEIRSAAQPDDADLAARHAAEGDRLEDRIRGDEELSHDVSAALDAALAVDEQRMEARIHDRLRDLDEQQRERADRQRGELAAVTAAHDAERARAEQMTADPPATPHRPLPPPRLHGTSAPSFGIGGVTEPIDLTSHLVELRRQVVDELGADGADRLLPSSAVNAVHDNLRAVHEALAEIGAHLPGALNGGWTVPLRLEERFGGRTYDLRVSASFPEPLVFAGLRAVDELATESSATVGAKRTVTTTRTTVSLAATGRGQGAGQGAGQGHAPAGTAGGGLGAAVALGNRNTTNTAEDSVAYEQRLTVKGPVAAFRGPVDITVTIGRGTGRPIARIDVTRPVTVLAPCTGEAPMAQRPRRFPVLHNQLDDSGRTSWRADGEAAPAPGTYAVEHLLTDLAAVRKAAEDALAAAGGAVDATTRTTLRSAITSDTLRAALSAALDGTLNLPVPAVAGRGLRLDARLTGPTRLIAVEARVSPASKRRIAGERATAETTGWTTTVTGTAPHGYGGVTHVEGAREVGHRPNFGSAGVSAWHEQELYKGTNAEFTIESKTAADELKPPVPEAGEVTRAVAYGLELLLVATGPRGRVGGAGLRIPGGVVLRIAGADGVPEDLRRAAGELAERAGEWTPGNADAYWAAYDAYQAAYDAYQTANGARGPVGHE